MIGTASLREINIKANIRKIILAENFPDIIVDQGFKLIDIKLEHTMKLLKIPQIHKDPFDRILVAQTLVEGCKIIT